MYDATYAIARQREILTEAARSRQSRTAELSRRCRAKDGPSTVRLFVDAVRGGHRQPVAC